MRKKKFKNFPLLFLLLLFIFLGAIYFALGINKISTEKMIVVVPKGADDKTILETLQDKGLIKNRLTYYTILALSNFVKKIEPGGYVLPKNLNALAIHSALTEPDYKYVAVVEGMRKEEIAEKVGETLGWHNEKIESFKTKYPLCSFSGQEGYLFPGDYLVNKDATIQSIQDEMQKNFHENFDKLGKNTNKKISDIDQIVTIASLIQRESGGKRDMRLISGIIWNRLFEGMPLQIDATLQYAKGTDGKWWPSVKSEDKFIDSPFNTGICSILKNSYLP